MGIFDRILRRPSSPEEPEEPLRCISISSPQPAPGQSNTRRDYPIPALDEDTFVPTGIDASRLPTYDHLFPNGPYKFFPTPPPRPGPKDPRRQMTKQKAVTIPTPVLGIICGRQLIDNRQMAILARLDHAIYNTVIPHLYRQVTIDRYSLPKLLYGIPLPVSGFAFDPKATFNAKGKKKQVYSEEDVISAPVERRKRKCLQYVKEIILDEPLLDWKTCQSLIRLKDPDFAMDASDTQPAGQFHPMREPVDTSVLDTDSTASLMPNVETVYLTPGLTDSLAQWAKTAKSPHLLLNAIPAICGRKTIKFINVPNTSQQSQQADARSGQDDAVKDVVDQINDTFGAESMNWNPFLRSYEEEFG